MQILHIYPALAVVADAPRIKPDLITIEGIGELYVYRKVNVYLDTAERRTRYSDSDRDTYFALIADGVLGRIATAPNDEAFRELSSKPALFGPNVGKTPLEYFPEILAAQREVLADPEGYTARESSARAAEREERKQADAKRQAEKETALAKQRQEAHARNLAKWNTGESIEWAAFEELCASFGVLIHIRTIGACRQNVSAISKTGWSIAVSCKANPSPAIRALNDAITETEKPEVVSPEVARLFGTTTEAA